MRPAYSTVSTAGSGAATADQPSGAADTQAATAGEGSATAAWVGCEGERQAGESCCLYQLLLHQIFLPVVPSELMPCVTGWNDCVCVCVYVYGQIRKTYVYDIIYMHSCLHTQIGLKRLQVITLHCSTFVCTLTIHQQGNALS